VSLIFFVSTSTSAISPKDVLVTVDSSLAINSEPDFSGSTRTATAISLLHDGLVDSKIIYNEEYGVYEAAYRLATPGIDFKPGKTPRGFYEVDWESPRTVFRPCLFCYGI